MFVNILHRVEHRSNSRVSAARVPIYTNHGRVEHDSKFILTLAHLVIDTSNLHGEAWSWYGRGFGFV